MKNIWCRFSICAALVVIAYACQYSGINYKAFGNFIYEIKYPLGRLCDMLSCAIGGIIIAFLYSRICLKRQMVIVVIAGILMGMVGVFCAYHFQIECSYGYSGVDKMLIGMGAVTIFSFGGKIINLKQCNVIDMAGKYTVGVYVMHLFVARIISKIEIVLNVSLPSILYCLIIYLCCYAVCCIADKLLGNKITWLKYII